MSNQPRDKQQHQQGKNGETGKQPGTNTGGQGASAETRSGTLSGQNKPQPDNKK